MPPSVVAVHRVRSRLRARTSGNELETQLGQVFWLERGLIVRERDFSDWDEALREVLSIGRPKVAVDHTG